MTAVGRQVITIMNILTAGDDTGLDILSLSRRMMLIIRAYVCGGQNSNTIKGGPRVSDLVRFSYQ